VSPLFGRSSVLGPRVWSPGAGLRHVKQGSALQPAIHRGGNILALLHAALVRGSAGSWTEGASERTWGWAKELAASCERKTQG